MCTRTYVRANECLLKGHILESMGPDSQRAYTMCAHKATMIGFPMLARVSFVHRASSVVLRSGHEIGKEGGEGEE